MRFYAGCKIFKLTGAAHPCRQDCVVAWPAAQATQINKIKPLASGDTKCVLTGTLICRVICAAIAVAGRSRGRLLRSGEEAAFAGLFANHSRCLLEHIKHMNWDIKNSSPRLALYDLHAIIDFGIIVEGFLWQAHMNGRFADMDCCGGPSVILKEVKGNSLSAISIPGHRQVLGYYRYTDGQIRAVLERFLYLAMPCPAELLLLIVQITRLRVGVATKPRCPNAAASRTEAMFEKADDFDLDIWVEESPLFTKTFANYYGEIFQLAVKLYGILTLPPSAVLRVYLNAFEANGPRTLLRQKLVAILKDLYPKLQDYGSVQWPLVVAGVAASIGDGAAEDQDFNAQPLEDIWRRPLSDFTPYWCLKKLKAFWLSGKTGWENCFYEPAPC